MELPSRLAVDMNHNESVIEFAWNGEQPRLEYSLVLFQVVTGLRWQRVEPPQSDLCDLLWVRRLGLDSWMNYAISENWKRLEFLQPNPDAFELGLFKRPCGIQTDWLLSMLWLALRVEERFATLDEHGRFRSSDSLAARAGIERIPWVHRWAEAVAHEWGLNIDPPRRSKVNISVDIDHLLAFAGRNWLHVGLAGFRDIVNGKIANAFRRWRARAGGQDPYDTLLEQMHLWKGQPWNYFALMQLERNEQDSGVDFSNRRAQSLWKQLDHKLPDGLGWHPSTGASKGARRGLLEKEYRQVARLLGRQVRRSRFHFLSFQPEVHYPLLESLGIQEEHSMGYTDRIGWRAGIAVPYPWFDLERNAALGLWVHPFFAMDGHLLYYQPTANPFEEWHKAYSDCLEQGVPFSWVTHWRLFSEVDPIWVGWNDQVKKMIQWDKD